MPPSTALQAQRHAAPYYFPSDLTAPLAAASDALCALATSSKTAAEQWAIAATAKDAAEALYEIAERAAMGEPTDPATCSEWMDLAQRIARSKLADLHRHFGVPVVPKVAD